MLRERLRVGIARGMRNGKKGVDIYQYTYYVPRHVTLKAPSSWGLGKENWKFESLHPTGIVA